MKVIVHRDPQHLAESAAGQIADAVNGATHETFSLGLAGGSTPIGAYRILGDRQVSWDRVDAWMSDERWVPQDHPDCNGHQAAIELLDYVGARFHRPRWASWMTAADSAAHYEAELRSIHPTGRADLILLGMGDDGHTASLFPGTDALSAPPARWFVANYVPHLDADRLTATYEFIRAAHRVFFLVAGGAKAPALRQVLEAGELPAAGVLGGDADVTWLVDEAAAAELTTVATTRSD